MLRRIAFPALLGIAGLGLFVGLGSWQLQRLAWKEGILAAIESRIHAAPVSLPVRPAQEVEGFLPVVMDGHPAGKELLVLLSRTGFGPGYRSVTAFETEGRRVLLDRGFVPAAYRDQNRDTGDVRVTGNLHWPQEFDRLFTPEPDGNLWFARRVEEMAAELETEPVMVVARSLEPPVANLHSWPVDTGEIPNNHLNYAITWFGLAAAWVGMTAFWLWRINRRE